MKINISDIQKQIQSMLFVLTLARLQFIIKLKIEISIPDWKKLVTS